MFTELKLGASTENLCANLDGSSMLQRKIRRKSSTYASPRKNGVDGSTPHCAQG
jgi:hypothetical protein